MYYLSAHLELGHYIRNVQQYRFENCVSKVHSSSIVSTSARLLQQSATITTPQNVLKYFAELQYHELLHIIHIISELLPSPFSRLSATVTSRQLILLLTASQLTRGNKR